MLSLKPTSRDLIHIIPLPLRQEDPLLGPLLDLLGLHMVDLDLVLLKPIGGLGLSLGALLPRLESLNKGLALMLGDRLLALLLQRGHQLVP